MSKAFTKEGEGDSLDDLPPVEPWPLGVKNYLTPVGHAALKREIEALREPAHGDARKKVEREQRLQALLQRLEAAEVIDPAGQPRDIVGVDEADPKRGWVSWRSPIARALTGRRVGDTTTVRTPARDEELTVTGID